MRGHSPRWQCLLHHSSLVRALQPYAELKLFLGILLEMPVLRRTRYFDGETCFPSFASFDAWLASVVSSAFWKPSWSFTFLNEAAPSLPISWSWQISPAFRPSWLPFGSS